MFNVNPVNETACCSAVPENKNDGTSLCDKIRSLHEMISEAEGITRETKAILFGEKTVQEKCPEPSVTCMGDDVDAMIRQMKQILDCLRETRNLIW